MPKVDPKQLTEEAILAYTLGNTESALEKLRQVVIDFPQNFSGWHALAEVCLASGLLEEALRAAEEAYALTEDDVHICTTLSRIWVRLQNTEKAEHFGSQARMRGWKEQLKEPSM